MQGAADTRSVLPSAPGRKRAGRPLEFKAKKEGHGKCRALIVVKVINLQRGTADAAVLGGKPPCASTEGDMGVFCAWHNRVGRMPDMRAAHGQVTKKINH